MDSTRKGKRFPDSMSKTIPIWTCVLNRSIRNHLSKTNVVALLNDGVSNIIVIWSLWLHSTIQVDPKAQYCCENFGHRLIGNSNFVRCCDFVTIYSKILCQDLNFSFSA